MKGGGDLVDVTSDYGKFSSVVGAIIAVIIALLLIIIGAMKFFDKHTASARATVRKVLSVKPHKDNSGMVNFDIEVDFDYTVGGTRHTATRTYRFPNRLNIGDAFDIQYNPINPIDIAYELSPKWVGLGFMGLGAVIGVTGVMISYFAMKSKTFSVGLGMANIFGR